MDAIISYADPPFACPPDVAIDLPFPPSVNRIWRNGSSGADSVYLAPSYVKWKKAADALLYSSREWRSVKITGRFTAEIFVCPPKGHQRGDLDNRIKAILDYLQHVGIIVDDKYCMRLTIEWVDPARAPEGMRVVVRPCE